MDFNGAIILQWQLLHEEKEQSHNAGISYNWLFFPRDSYQNVSQGKKGL